ncbi:MAG: hypothetical protein ACXVPU_11865 [Bacteroidia bacterium]
MRKDLLFLLITILAIYGCSKDKGIPQSAITSEKYFPKVKTIIQSNCTNSCHAPSLGFYNGLPVILESDSNIVAEGLSIKSAVSGPFSIINKQMPQGGSLSASDINVINQWLLKGGKASD